MMGENIRIKESVLEGEKITILGRNLNLRWRGQLLEIWSEKDYPHRIIEKQRRYKRGQRFKVDGRTYLLAQIDGNKVNLINIETGNRWTDSLKVSDPLLIDHEELRELIGDKYFTSLAMVRKR
jgi:hypothetical protein